MQQFVVPQVGVVQTVLGAFAVVPEGQEKLTLPQVALTECEERSTKTSADALSPPGQSWAGPHSAGRPTARHKKNKK